MMNVKTQRLLQHLEQENQYAETVLKHTEASQEQLLKRSKAESRKTTIRYQFVKVAITTPSKVTGDNEYPVHLREKHF